MKNGGGKAEQKEDGWDARRPFIHGAGPFKKGEQNPIVERRFVVVKFTEKSGDDVVAGKLHFQCHQ